MSTNNESRTRPSRVVHVKKENYDLYIGRYNSYLGERGSFLANPFKIGPGTSREESIQRYRNWFYDQIENTPNFRDRVLALKGKTLGCWCKPLACHGDVIVEFLEEESSKPSLSNSESRPKGSGKNCGLFA